MPETVFNIADMLSIGGKMIKQGWRVEFTGGDKGWYTWTSPKGSKYQSSTRDLPPNEAIEEYQKKKDKKK